MKIKHWSTVFAAIFFMITTILVSNKIIEIHFFLGIIISIATIYYGHLKYKIEDDKMFKELFDDFNKRYDDKFNDLINEIRDGYISELTREQKNKIIDYFNLCAEEFLWYKKGRIPFDVWSAWKSGMIANIQIPLVYRIYKLEISNTNILISYYELITELEIK